MMSQIFNIFSTGFDALAGQVSLGDEDPPEQQVRIQVPGSFSVQETPPPTETPARKHGSLVPHDSGVFLDDDPIVLAQPTGDAEDHEGAMEPQAAGPAPLGETAPLAHPVLGTPNAQDPDALYWDDVLDPEELADEERQRFFMELEEIEEREVEQMLLPEDATASGTPPHMDATPSSTVPKGMHIIAHSQALVKAFDSLDVSWSVQWQIGVIQTSGPTGPRSIDASRLRELQGNNSAAGPRVSEVFLGRPQARVSRSYQPWVELDKEEEATRLVRLGLSEESQRDVMGSWWGGRVEQPGVILRIKRPGMISPIFRVQLLQQKVEGKSFRFRRQFGSRRFIRLKLPDIRPNDSAALQQFLSQGFILHGRILRAFYGEDGDVHLVETDENFERAPVTSMGDQERISFEEFAQWHNPVQLNGRQVMSKYATRWKIGLSPSVPVVLFASENIFFIPDIEHNEVMTDGCGRINMAAMRLIQQHRQLPTMPTAVQGRLAGAKGLWMVDKFDAADEPRIWCTDSQVKIRYSPETLSANPALRILDFLRFNHVKITSSMSAQPIINLAHNGVPHSAFVDILQTAVRTELDTLIAQWESNNVAVLLGTLFVKGRVGQVRKQRQMDALMRSFSSAERNLPAVENLGLLRQNFLDVELPAFWPDPVTGYPDHPSERAVELIQAGFVPQQCPPLATAVKKVLIAEKDRILGGLHLPLPFSAEGWAVPDFLGVLEPGEVYFRSSEPLEMPDGSRRNSLEGPVLVWRSPNRLPSDTQKLRAVDHPELRPWEDLVIFSTKGGSSSMALLSGGDFDGDTVVITWNPAMVLPFENANAGFAQPPPDFDHLLTYTKETAQEMHSSVKGLPIEEQRLILQDQYLKTCTTDTFVGYFSKIADIMTYAYGYDSAEATRYAHLFNNALDCAKSGKFTKPEVVVQAQMQNRRRPPCMESLEEAARSSHLRPHLPRLDHLPPFVLDTLQPLISQMMQDYNQHIQSLGQDFRQDTPLLISIQEARQQATHLQNLDISGKQAELDQLIQFVEGCYQDWEVAYPLHIYNRGTRHAPAYQYKERAARLQNIAKVFFEGFDFSSLAYFSRNDARLVMASYAYELEYRTKRGHSADFAFTVAFPLLCLLKAGNGGTSIRFKVMGQDFSDHMITRKGLAQDLQELAP